VDFKTANLPRQTEFQCLFLLPFCKVVTVGLVEAVLAVGPSVADILLGVAAFHQTRKLSRGHVALTRESSLRNLNKIKFKTIPDMRKSIKTNQTDMNSKAFAKKKIGKF
jgi:hypothetical protein